MNLSRDQAPGILGIRYIRATSTCGAVSYDGIENCLVIKQDVEMTGKSPIDRWQERLLLFVRHVLQDGC